MIKYLFFTTITILTFTLGSQAKETSNEVIRLWSIEQIGGEQNKLKQDSEDRGGGKTTFRNIKDPNLTFYPAKSDKPAPTIVYCPGGGYIQVSVVQPYIDWLNSIGYNVFFLKYSVPNMREAAFKDIQRAMRVVKHNAKKWNVDPNKIGVMGESAGGHLVARLSQNYLTPAYKAQDEADKQDCEPDFVIIISGAYFAKKRGGSVLADKHFHMKNDVAPTYFIYAKDDSKFINGGITYQKALTKAGKEAQIQIYEKGGHQLEGVNWYPECEKWLKQQVTYSKE